MGNLSNLHSLYLYSNQLTGTIPPELGNLTNLDGFFLDHNQLTGSIPSELGNLTSLLYVRINDNHLSGAVPSSITNWESCQERCPLGEWNFENTYDDTSGSEYHLTPYGTVPLVLGVGGGMSTDFSGGSTTYPVVPGSIDVLDSADSPRAGLISQVSMKRVYPSWDGCGLNHLPSQTRLFHKTAAVKVQVIIGIGSESMPMVLSSS